MSIAATNRTNNASDPDTVSDSAVVINPTTQQHTQQSTSNIASPAQPVLTVTDNAMDSILPREFRQRLHKHFANIEREFLREYRRLYNDNLALQERLEKFEDGDHPETTTLAKKSGASMLSQRIKQQYKQSTSRLVSTLRQSASGLSTAPTMAATGNVCSTIIGAAPINTRPSTGFGQTSSGQGPVAFAGHGGGWQLMNRIGGHRDGIWEVTPYRQFAATASADATVRLWNNDWLTNCLLLYSGHSGSVNSVRFRSRDNLMVTAGGDGTAHLIRLPYESLVKAAGCLGQLLSTSLSSQTVGATTVPVSIAVNSAASNMVSIAGATIAGSPNAACSASATALETAISSLVNEFTCSTSIPGIGTGMAMAGSNFKVSSYLPALDNEDNPSGAVIANDSLEDGAPEKNQHGSPIRSFSFGAISTTPLVHVRHPHSVFQSANLSTFNSAVGGPTGPKVGSLSYNYIESFPLSAADFLTDRDQLVTAGWDRLGRIYDLNTAQEVDSLTGHDHQLTDVRCAPGGAPIAVTSSRDGTFRLWDFRQSGMRVHIQQAHSQTVSTTQFITGGPTERLVSAGMDRYCRLWDLRQSRDPVVTIRTDAAINRLAISGTGVGNLSSTGDSSEPLSNLVSPPINGHGETGILNTSSVSSGLASTTLPTHTPSTTIASQPGTVGSTPVGPVWATSINKILALPLENRGIKFYYLNGNRIGRLTRSSSRGHARMVTSVAWSDEGVCNFFSTGFDSQLLTWQISLT